MWLVLDAIGDWHDVLGKQQGDKKKKRAQKKVKSQRSCEGSSFPKWAEKGQTKPERRKLRMQARTAGGRSDCVFLSQEGGRLKRGRIQGVSMLIGWILCGAPYVVQRVFGRKVGETTSSAADPLLSQEREKLFAEHKVRRSASNEWSFQDALLQHLANDPVACLDCSEYLTIRWVSRYCASRLPQLARNKGW